MSEKINAALTAITDEVKRLESENKALNLTVLMTDGVNKAKLVKQIAILTRALENQFIRKMDNNGVEYFDKLDCQASIDYAKAELEGE